VRERFEAVEMPLKRTKKSQKARRTFFFFSAVMATSCFIFKKMMASYWSDDCRLQLQDSFVVEASDGLWNKCSELALASRG
jgi:hypothetical protein